jgi:RHS repeat-associated protein
MAFPLDKVLTVRDAATGAPYWQLTRVDDAGRYRTEVLGQGTTTERTYFDAKQRVKTLTTESAATTVQSLAYDYDARLDLVSRTDVLQPQHPTERFRYDALERLTCAYFSPTADPAAPCHTSYGYAPDGNLTSKSDIGGLAYNDPAHPHAVTEAGGDSFGYDAAGNQKTRPGGVTITYTAFDLPRTVTQAGGTISFGYDGDERRVRKTTSAEETLYFGDLYERVTDASAKVAHRYHIFSPERVIAIVTRGGNAPGTLYLHADHLGSVDAVTNDAGSVEERRSDDAFGQRRNPVWGDPPPAVFESKTSLGFTGHESDAELGLVNMRGRIFDPRIGRFLTTDPLIADVTFGQRPQPLRLCLECAVLSIEGSDDLKKSSPLRSESARKGAANVLGIFAVVGGATGEVLGGAASVTGIGAAIGVPAMVVSTTLVVGRAANVAAGFRGLVRRVFGGSGSNSNCVRRVFGGSGSNSNCVRRVFGGSGSEKNARSDRPQARPARRAPVARCSCAPPAASPPAFGTPPRAARAPCSMDGGAGRGARAHPDHGHDHG